MVGGGEGLEEGVGEVTPGEGGGEGFVEDVEEGVGEGVGDGIHGKEKNRIDTPCIAVRPMVKAFGACGCQETAVDKGNNRVGRLESAGGAIRGHDNAFSRES